MNMLWSGLLLGIAGSFHCLGMCAPIAFALQQNGGNSWKNKLSYNLGRITTYVALGAFVGAIGNVLAFSGMQQGLSYFSGGLMVIVGLLAVNLDTVLFKIPKFQKFYSHLSNLMGKALQRQNSAFFIGLANGLLPCGLVYFALFGAMASATLLEGMLYMGVFGLGTMPMMLGSALLGQVVRLKWRNLFKKVYPVLFVLIGLLVLYKANNISSVQGRAGGDSAICVPN